MPATVTVVTVSPSARTASRLANSGRAEMTALLTLAPTRSTPTKTASRPSAVPTTPAARKSPAEAGVTPAKRSVPWSAASATQ